MLIKKRATDIDSLDNDENIPLKASDLRNMIDTHSSFFNEMIKDAVENELYLKGQNLTKEQKQIYANKGRGHFPVALTADKISRVIKSQQDAKRSAKAEPLSEGSEIKAELYTQKFKKVEKDSEFEFVSSEIFTSGVGVKYGAAEIIIDYDHKKNPIVKIIKRDYQDVRWDGNAQEYDKSDGNFMGYQKKVARMDIRLDYGNKVADRISINSGTWGRNVQQNWGLQDKSGRNDFDIILIYCVWVKTMRDTWHVVFNGEDYVEYSKSDAESKELLLKLPYIMQDLEIPPSEIVKHSDWAYDYYETTFNEILYYEQTNLPFFPLEIYQAFHFEGEIWCLTDLLKPNNKLLDKMLTQIDYALGTDVKNGWELVVSWLEQGITVEKAIQMVKNGEPLPVIRPGAITPIKQKGFNPQWMEVLTLVKTFEDQLSGGDLYSGVREGKSRESEKAVLAKLSKQEAIAGIFVNNLSRWHRSLFKKVAWFIEKYDTYESQQKITQTKISPMIKDTLLNNGVFTPSKINEGQGYLKYNVPGNDFTSLANPDIDIYVTDESLSNQEKVNIYENMLMAEKSFPDLLLSQTWNEKKMELIETISYEDRAKVWQEIQEAKQAQMQQAQMQQQKAEEFEQQKINVEKAKALISDRGQVIPSIKQEKTNAKQSNN